MCLVECLEKERMSTRTSVGLRIQCASLLGGMRSSCIHTHIYTQSETSFQRRTPTSFVPGSGHEGGQVFWHQ